MKQGNKSTKYIRFHFTVEETTIRKKTKHSGYRSLNISGMPILTALPVYDRETRVSMILFPGTVKSPFLLPHGIRIHDPQDVSSKLCPPV